MADRDLIQSFDAALPRLTLYAPRSVPLSGAREYHEHTQKTKDRRADLALLSGGAVVTGAATWFIWLPWVPLWILVPMLVAAVTCGAGAGHRFLQLAFERRLEQALPPGTDAATAQLEDGIWELIRRWNYDAFLWNGRVDQLRLEVADWQRLRDVPETRGIEWTSEGSQIRAEGLVAEMRGLSSDRAALSASREVIEHRLRGLDARLLQLKASEEGQYLSLPAPVDDGPEDDG